MLTNLCICVTVEQMDIEKIVSELKIHMQKWQKEAEEFIQRTPPNQLYAAIGVVIFTIFLFLIGNALYILYHRF